MRFFSQFSYRRLGMGCLLSGNVCEVTGIEDDGQAVLLLEGSGVPKITIKAYNRRIDWPQMVSNLVTTTSEEIRIEH